MKEFSHYTDEDFQNYFDNNFAGDINLLKNHVEECELCGANFKAYAAVWSFARTDLRTEPLRIDLAYAVANKVFAVKEREPVFEKVMYGLFICLGIVCMVWCFNYIMSNSTPAPFILLIIPFFLYLLLTYKEIKIMKQKFALE